MRARIMPFSSSLLFSSYAVASMDVMNDATFHPSSSESSHQRVLSEACASLEAGDDFATHEPLDVRYSYEVLSTLPPLQVGFAVESAVSDYLKAKLITRTCHHQNNESNVLGVDIGGTGVISTNECILLTMDDPALNCYHMVGSNTLFVDHLDDTSQAELLQKQTERMVVEAFGSKDIFLGPAQSVYGMYMMKSFERRYQQITAFADDESVDQGNNTAAKAKGMENPNRFYDDSLLLAGIVAAVLTVAALVTGAIMMWHTVRTCGQVLEEEAEEELNLRDEYFRITLGAHSGEEQDITDDIKFSYSADGDEVTTANPFTDRLGKTLSWKGVSMSVAGSGNGPLKWLLDDVWGEVPQGQTTAIMGASGAGKTSLLNILAGRAVSRGPVRVYADIRLDGRPVRPTDMNVRKSIAFVSQDDALQSTATPREAIRFSAKLRLPKSTSENELDSLTNQILSELGLLSCADTIMGGPLVKGVSGGERKRTSIGVELVVKPKLLFLDEPTSHLDSFSALQCMRVLKKVAKTGASVLFTIHQPSSDIFASFDHLILLQRGQLLYSGAVVSVRSYFRERGYPCPRNYNPADWILTVAQSVPMEELEEKGFFHECPDSDDDSSLSEYSISTDAAKPWMEDLPGLFTQASMITIREARTIRRDMTAVLARLFLSFVIAAFVGALYLNVGETNSAIFTNLHSHFGAVTTCSMVMMTVTSQTALITFPAERPIFLREYTTNHYSVLSYFLSRMVIDTAITAILAAGVMGIAYFLIDFRGSFHWFFLVNFTLGLISTSLANVIGASVNGNKKLATQCLPLAFVPQLLFAGFFVVPALIPEWIRWIQYICPLTYSVRILLVAEFSDCVAGQKLFCEFLLEKIEADQDELWWYWLVLAAQFLVLRIMALVLLKQNARRFY